MKLTRELIRNLEMGAQSIKNLMPYVDDDKLKNTVLKQKEALEDFLAQAKSDTTDEEQEQASGSKLQKTMLKAGVNVNAMFNSNPTHIADMLIEGYRMGIDSVQKCMNELKREGKEMPPLASEVIRFYDKSIKALREFL